MRKILVALAIFLNIASAQAAVTTITFLDGASSSHNGAFALDAGSDAYALSVICGGATGTLGATVNACAIFNGDGGFETHIVNTNANGQATANNSQPVVLPAVQVPANPCMLQKATTVTLNSNATSSTQIIGLVALNNIYICSAVVVPTSATVFNLVEGVGTNCTGGSPAQQAIVGSTTAANGVPLGAGAILQLSGDNLWTTHNAGDAICFTQTVAEALSITLSYVQTIF